MLGEMMDKCTGVVKTVKHVESIVTHLWRNVAESAFLKLRITQ